MNASTLKAPLFFALAATGLLLSDPAHAFRCKSKIIKDGMHEQQVLAKCGKPTTSRHLGFTVRSFDLGHYRVASGAFRSRRFGGSSQISHEVAIIEYVYNFGPRKLMRRLIFEGGVLVSIDTIGYGYIEKKSR